MEVHLSKIWKNPTWGSHEFKTVLPFNDFLYEHWSQNRIIHKIILARDSRVVVKDVQMSICIENLHLLT